MKMATHRADGFPAYLASCCQELLPRASPPGEPPRLIEVLSKPSQKPPKESYIARRRQTSTEHEQSSQAARVLADDGTGVATLAPAAAPVDSARRVHFNSNSEGNQVKHSSQEAEPPSVTRAMSMPATLAGLRLPFAPKKVDHKRNPEAQPLFACISFGAFGGKFVTRPPWSCALSLRKGHRARARGPMRRYSSRRDARSTAV